MKLFLVKNPCKLLMALYEPDDAKGTPRMTWVGVVLNYLISECMNSELIDSNDDPRLVSNKLGLRLLDLKT